ncbi:eIF2B GDP-GTP exchange factor [Heterostelium album PN500]|uniref:Translation initiation factor eIF2B subunit delta n=1 Tax=Heterostelium pallidum (strain ATCC 26659 / Pp 5 / PN500) TaxID=670386 RepID=D3BSV5_HETP5|nr:eIF2B GDP-GTP exchange factor [Heterostelium album PN500]EFA75570.1 eIF2B GDP-GTP exchange factor [Heterostelium album PN500]|eukprot:XP_020427704.1 eIF2B GDP-GTP exchange factor [Heterostelium album PN500]
MSYKDTYIQKESNITRALGEFLDEREEKGKPIKTVGFDINKQGGQSTSPIPIPSTSPSQANIPSKSPSTRGSMDKQHIKKSTGSPGSMEGISTPHIPTSSSMEIPKPTTDIPDVGKLQISNSADSSLHPPAATAKPQQQQNRQQQQQQQQGGQQQQGQPRPAGQTKKQQQRLLQQQQQAAEGGVQSPSTHPKQHQQQGGQQAQAQQGKQQQQQQQGGQQQQKKQSNPSTPSIQSPPNEDIEEQNAAKALAANAPKKGGVVVVQSTQFDDQKKRDKATKKKIINAVPATKLIPLFAHLPQYEIENSLGIVNADIHPEIISLGLKYANFTISGSNARAVAMMTTFKQVIRDFHLPAEKDFARELNAHLTPLIQFLVDCRPMSISMSNSIIYFKQQCLSEINKKLTNEEAKEFLCEKIDSFIERIVVADRVIAQYGVSKIKDGDVIMTYASSHVVEMILVKAQEEGKNFRVIIVDSRPKHEGKRLMHRLVQHGVKCTYILLNATSYIMKEVTKVFVGACSLLSNGNLISRSGTALVASMAQFYNVPFIVCCETYKFSDKSQLDSICSNDLGDPKDLVSNLSEKDVHTDNVLKDWKNISSLKLLNLMYDLTPIELIALVITEFDIDVLKWNSVKWNDIKNKPTYLATYNYFHLLNHTLKRFREKVKFMKIAFDSGRLEFVRFLDSLGYDPKTFDYQDIIGLAPLG